MLSAWTLKKSNDEDLVSNDLDYFQSMSCVDIRYMHDTHPPGDRFGELAFINRTDRAASVTVPTLVLH